MLTPEYLWSAADVVVNTYDEMNNWAIRDMAERIMTAELYGDKLPGTARYRAWMMNQSGMHYEEMSKKLAEITKKAEPDIMKLFIEAGLTSVANDYAPFGMEPYDITKDKVATQILESVYKKTKGELHNYTRTTLDQSNKLFIDVLDKAFYEISTGMRSYNEVIQEAIETVSKEGCTVKYPSGHVDKQEVAVRRAVMTGVSQASSQITLHNCEVLDTDYVIITAHSGARYSETDKIANHIGWQGGVYKLHGVSSEKSEDVDKIIKYNRQRGIQFQGDVIPNLEEETGFPNNPLGLCGYNCRHNIRAFQIEYMDPYSVNPEIDEEKSNREYDLIQKQRAKERSIRDTRRELIGLDAAIGKCKDEETKFNLQMNYDKTAKKLERQTDAYNQFCDENNLTRDYNRMQTAKFDREQAYKATRGAKRYSNSIEKSTNNDIMKRKKKAENAIEPMPKKQLRKIVKGFAKQGGKIQMDAYTDEYLKSKKAEAITYNMNTILLHTNPGRAAVFEELIHATQYRQGKNDGSYVSRVLCEIEAQKKLLKYQNEYKLTKQEVKQTKLALDSYEKELKLYREAGGQHD
jgi:arginine repressor